jgi:hypothetical protein
LRIGGSPNPARVEPFSRVEFKQVVTSEYNHLRRWQTNIATSGCAEPAVETVADERSNTWDSSDQSTTVDALQRPIISQSA